MGRQRAEIKARFVEPAALTGAGTRLILKTMEHPVVLFDGVCNLCDAAVNFIIKRDRAKRLRFCALQSEIGRRLLLQAGLSEPGLETMILIEDERAYSRSTAALRIARKLDGPWPLAAVFLLIPAFLRDAAYNAVARNRYRWFGKLDACARPTQDLKSRFLD